MKAAASRLDHQTRANRGPRRLSGIAALVCALLSAAPAPAEVWGAELSYDGGGRVLDYYEQVRSANHAGKLLRIDGYCASACTMKLGARNICITPDALLVFHSARTREGALSPAGNIIMTAVYPRAIRNWVRARGTLDSSAMTEMTGLQAIALGVRPC